jgi:hypothetical protein
MRKFVLATSAAALLCMLLPQTSFAQDESSPFVVSDGISSVHILPTQSASKELNEILPPAGALTYHGGPVMVTQSTYAIFWLPASGKLQNGASTHMSAAFQPVLKRFLTDYAGHGISNNSTQYYQVVGSTTTYVHNTDGFVTAYVDTDPYPASGCNDSATPGDCITDAQIQAEIAHVIAVNHWTAGPTKMFLMFTSSGEGSCFNSSNSSCAYTQYCAYHGYFGSGSTEVIYGNEPYLDKAGCTISNLPNGDLAADSTANVASHEMTEADTDPQLNAWWDSANGEEIGDLCAWGFGTNTWDSGKANQMWNGDFYELQREYDNHQSTCVQVGP